MDPADKLGYEVAEIGGLMNAVRTATSKAEQIEMVRRLFVFLTSTTEILRRERFRENVKLKIEEFMRDAEIRAGLIDIIGGLCDKIKTYDPRDIPGCPEAPVGAMAAAAAAMPAVAAAMPAVAAAMPAVAAAMPAVAAAMPAVAAAMPAVAAAMPAAAAAMPAAAAAAAAVPNYTVIGSGGYGAVFNPALPNIVRGAKVEYPGNVTKMFYRKKNLDSAMSVIARLPTIMGVNEGHRTNRYSRSFRGSNLPPALFAKLKLKNPALKPSTSMHFIRMPHLGVDVEHITEGYIEIRRRPFTHILNQVLKVFRQTATLAAHKYAHFDIRNSNVMVTPSNGNITIVDFDWTKQYNTLYNDYPLGFWSNPPETLFLYDLPLGSPIPVDPIIRAFLLTPTRSAKLSQYEDFNLLNNKIALGSMGVGAKAALHDRLVSANVANYKYLLSKGYMDSEKLIKEQCFPYIDNYGLAITMLEFLAVVYAFNINEPVERMVNKGALATRITNEGTPYSDEELDRIVGTLTDLIQFLHRVGSFVLEERPSPDTAVAQLELIVAGFAPMPVPELPAAAGAAAAGAAAAGAAAAGAAAAANANNNARRELMRMAVLAGNANALRNNRRSRRRRADRRKSRKARK